LKNKFVGDPRRAYSQLDSTLFAITLERPIIEICINGSAREWVDLAGLRHRELVFDPDPSVVSDHWIEIEHADGSLLHLIQFTKESRRPLIEARVVSPREDPIRKRLSNDFIALDDRERYRPSAALPVLSPHVLELFEFH
jgi:hypothetical protein